MFLDLLRSILLLEILKRLADVDFHLLFDFFGPFVVHRLVHNRLVRNRLVHNRLVHNRLVHNRDFL